jgi:F420-dependent oxidoreductase-like protein
MKIMFGPHFPPEDKTFTQMRVACQAAEEQGYDHFTITDHFYPMRPPNSPGYPLECWSTLAGLAAVTNRIRLGPLVTCVGYRPPTLLGKIATTVDDISNGRLILGIGAGWHEAEYKAYYGQFPTVGEREDNLDEAAQILHSMLHTRETSFKGKRYTVQNLVNLPQPVQKYVPIMIGGGGEKRTLRIAAKYADISHFFADTPDQVEQKITVLKQHCRRERRDFSEIKLATGLTPTFEAGRFPDRLTGQIEDGVKQGVSMFTVMFSRMGAHAADAQKRFAEEIMPSFGS